MNEMTTITELKYNNKQVLMDAYRSYVYLWAQVEVIKQLVDQLYMVVQIGTIEKVVNDFDQNVLRENAILIGNSGGK